MDYERHQRERIGKRENKHFRNKRENREELKKKCIYNVFFEVGIKRSSKEDNFYGAEKRRKMRLACQKQEITIIEQHQGE